MIQLSLYIETLFKSINLLKKVSSSHEYRRNFRSQILLKSPNLIFFYSIALWNSTAFALLRPIGDIVRQSSNFLGQRLLLSCGLLRIGPLKWRASMQSFFVHVWDLGCVRIPPHHWNYWNCWSRHGHCWSTEPKSLETPVIRNYGSSKSMRVIPCYR